MSARPKTNLDEHLRSLAPAVQPFAPTKTNNPGRFVPVSSRAKAAELPVSNQSLANSSQAVAAKPSAPLILPPSSASAAPRMSDQPDSDNDDDDILLMRHEQYNMNPPKAPFALAPKRPHQQLPTLPGASLGSSSSVKRPRISLESSRASPRSSSSGHIDATSAPNSSASLSSQRSDDLAIRSYQELIKMLKDNITNLRGVLQQRDDLLQDEVSAEDEYRMLTERSLRDRQLWLQRRIEQIDHQLDLRNASHSPNLNPGPSAPGRRDSSAYPTLDSDSSFIVHSHQNGTLNRSMEDTARNRTQPFAFPSVDQSDALQTRRAVSIDTDDMYEDNALLEALAVQEDEPQVNTLARQSTSDAAMNGNAVGPITYEIDDDDDFNLDDHTAEEKAAILGPTLEDLPTQRETKMQLNYPWSAQVQYALKKIFGLRQFRKNQLEAINAVLGGRDVFCLMPTGGGKSLCFQLPAVVTHGQTDGLTVVVTPLLSLMKDQVASLVKRNIPASFINGEMPQADREAVYKELSSRELATRLLYVTPEYLVSSVQGKRILQFQHRNKKLARIVVDEAHCVSSWGHDFRPDYKELGKLRTEYPGVPMMALTATANQRVFKDVKINLQLKNPAVFQSSFNRPNLEYQVRQKPKHRQGQLKEIANFINTSHRDQCGIIYCFSKKECEEIANDLTQEHGITADFYHATLSPIDKTRIQRQWQDGECKVVVATIAFGMGIDKADVRFVIHHTVPRSVEGYYQETGRAGRDGNSSVCVLYFSFSDATKIRRLIEEDDQLSPELKERQNDNFNQMVEYCKNQTDCRRVQILRYFDETFTREQCHRTCDNCCLDEGSFYTQDMTDAAIDLMKLIRAVTRRVGDTAKQICIDVFRGSFNKNVKGQQLDSPDFFHGVGKEIKSDEARRLLDELIELRALRVIAKPNAAGFNNEYIQMGPEANKMLARKIKVEMVFKREEQQQRRTTSAARRIAAQIRDEDLEFAPDPHDISNVPLTPPQARARTTRSATKASGSASRPSGSGVVVIDDQDADDADEFSVVASDLDEHQSCLIALNQWRARTARQRHRKAKEIVDDGTLQMVSAILPGQEAELVEIEGGAALIENGLSDEVLNISRRHRKAQAGAGKQSSTAGRSSTRPGMLNPLDFQSFAYNGGPSTAAPAKRTAAPAQRASASAGKTRTGSRLSNGTSAGARSQAPASGGVNGLIRPMPTRLPTHRF